MYRLTGVQYVVRKVQGCKLAATSDPPLLLQVHKPLQVPGTKIDVVKTRLPGDRRCCFTKIKNWSRGSTRTRTRTADWLSSCRPPVLD